MTLRSLVSNAQTKLIREPLLHFALAAVVLFAAYSWLNQSRPAVEGIEPVRVGKGEVQWLRETYANQWRRAPDSRELEGLVTDLVNEELLAREAQAMGLGENDTIVRRRLAQKLKFLVEDTSRLADPTEDELRKYFEKNLARFETGATVSFTHVYFNPQGRTNATLDAKAALAELRKAGGVGGGADIGDRFLLDAEIQDSDEPTVSNMFGADFAKAVFALKPGVWSGPFQSGYGLHLVFIETKMAAVHPVFATVRDKVTEDWRREKEETISRDYLARLREKYGVVYDDSVKAMLASHSIVDVAMQP